MLPLALQLESVRTKPSDTLKYSISLISHVELDSLVIIVSPKLRTYRNLTEFTNNDECASTIFLTGVNEMRTCDNNFQSQLKRDNDPSNTCAYVEVAKECYMTAFRKRCGQYPEVVWWGCNYERIGTQTNYPQCSQIFCT
ncbi:unnamed protein product, partial [Cylicostephanus goldi]